MSLQEAVSVAVGYLFVHVNGAVSLDLVLDLVARCVVSEVVGGVGVAVAMDWVHIHAVRVVMTVVMSVMVSIVVGIVHNGVVDVMVAIVMTIIVSIVVGVSLVVSWLGHDWVSVVVSMVMGVARWGNLVLLSVGVLGGVGSLVVVSGSVVRVDWLGVGVTVDINDWMVVV